MGFAVANLLRILPLPVDGRGLVLLRTRHEPVIRLLSLLVSRPADATASVSYIASMHVLPSLSYPSRQFHEIAMR